MSVSKITYESFDGDPFIDSISTDDATKGAYEILNGLILRMVKISFTHVVLGQRAWYLFI